MENFKKFERRQAASIDGLLSRPAQSSSRREGHQRGAATRQVPDATRLNGFARPDGFHGASSTSIDGFKAGSGPNMLSRSISPDGSGAATLGAIPAAPVAEPKKKSKSRRHWPLKKIFKRTILAVLILLVAGGAYFGVKLYLTGKHVFRGGAGAPALASTVDVSKLNGEGDGRINILMVGKGGDGHPGGQLTDTMMLASIDPVNNQSALLSIPRDFWVKIAGTNSYQKLNYAYELGREKSTAKTAEAEHADGIKLLEDTLGAVLGIPIHYYVMFDFTAYKQMVDTVGGVDINLKDPIFDPNFDNQYGRNALKLPAGNVHLNGTQALLLGRARGAAGGYGVRSDFDRNENQRKMLISLRNKIVSAGVYTNPVKVNQLMSTLGNHFQTSFSSVNELKRLHDIMQKIPSASIASLDLVTAPHDFLTTGSAGGLSVVYPKEGIGIYTAMQNYVRNTLKDGFLQNESATVAVFNDTTIAGLAGKQAQVLRSFGYNVTQVADAPNKQNGAKTVVVDLNNGAKKYTKRYLEQRYKTTVVTSIPNPQITTPPGTVDFVIMVGQDAANTP